MPKKKLVRRRFAGKVDRNKMGKRTRDINRLSLRERYKWDHHSDLPASPIIQVQYQSWLNHMRKYWAGKCLAYLQDRNIKTAIRHETKTSKPGYFLNNKFRYNSMLYMPQWQGA